MMHVISDLEISPPPSTRIGGGPLSHIWRLSLRRKLPPIRQTLLTSMTSKRGRKRNDNLPPNRARDVQRAFRARRAAHLLALEERVSELEEENSCLRQALNLPQASRAPLGKGPTGKDKPKATSAHDLPHDSPPPLAAHSFHSHSHHDSSPPSTGSAGSQCGSASPELVSRSAIEEIQNGTGPWGQTIVMEEMPQYQTLSPLPASATLAPKAVVYSSSYTTSRTSSSSLAPMYHMYPPSERSHSTPAYYDQTTTPLPVPQQAHRSYSFTPDSHAHSPYDPPYPPAPQRRVTADDYTLEGQVRHQGSHGGPIRLPSPPRGLHEHSVLPPHHRAVYSASGHIMS
ncbi:unnamed protein product [Mycena citricolor]|uniref:BZIP domain-containing protein n=1 Tax=Mycena citricolor TaxID=2018698 RepID=A0AAD2H6T3_9AGAR|nr:unnamed protein product [Mycena citricolor]